MTGSDKIVFDTDNKKLVEMIFLYVFCVLVYLRFWWMFAFIVFDVVFKSRLAKKNVSEMTYFVSGGDV